MKKVKSAYRSLELLDLLSQYPDGLTFTEITDQMGIAKSTAHELIQTLLHSAYVQYNAADKRYYIGSRVLSLGARYLQHSSDIRGAEAIAAQIYRAFGGNVSIGVLSGEQIVRIREYRRMDTAESIRTSEVINIPLYDSPLATVLMCYRDRADCRKLWTAFKHEISWEVFNHKLDEAARLGIVFEMESGDDHAYYSIAIPVKGMNGEVTAAVLISIEKSVTNDAQFKEMLFRIFDIAVANNGLPEYLDPHSDKKWIYLSVPNLNSQKALEHLRTFAADEAQSNRSWLFTNCYDDELKQRLLLEFIVHYRKPTCAVVIPVNASRSDELFRLCAQHALPVICFLRPSRSRFVEYFVGGDGYEQGVMQMEYVAKRLKGRGKVVILEGDPYNDNARNMVIGYHHVLQNHPRLELVQSASIANWNKDEAGEIIAELLEQGVKIDAIVAGTDQMAEGALEELRKYKLAGKVFLVGGDGDPSALLHIRDREQHATVFQHPRDAAEALIKVVAALSDGGLNDTFMERKSITRDYPGKEVLACTIPYTFIDRHNIDDLARYWRGDATFIQHH